MVSAHSALGNEPSAGRFMLSSKESQFFLFANVEFALGNSRSGCELILEKKKKEAKS